MHGQWRELLRDGQLAEIIIIIIPSFRMWVCWLMWDFPTHTISVYVKSKNTTRYLFFNMNSKVIVTNMSTQVTYGTNQISLLLDSTISCILSLCFLSILLQSERKRFYYRKYPNLVCTQVEIISDRNYLVRILFQRYVIFKAPNLVRTFPKI